MKFDFQFANPHGRPPNRRQREASARTCPTLPFFRNLGKAAGQLLPQGTLCPAALALRSFSFLPERECEKRLARPDALTSRAGRFFNSPT
jgi:hypothetical protein